MDSRKKRVVTVEEQKNELMMKVIDVKRKKRKNCERFVAIT